MINSLSNLERIIEIACQTKGTFVKIYKIVFMIMKKKHW